MFGVVAMYEVVDCGVLAFVCTLLDATAPTLGGYIEQKMGGTLVAWALV